MSSNPKLLFPWYYSIVFEKNQIIIKLFFFIKVIPIFFFQLQPEAINSSLVEKGQMKRRRFSFIPQIEKLPFNKVSSDENVSLYQKKSRSHSITQSHSAGNSNQNLSKTAPIDKKLRRMSSIGLSIKQFRKNSPTSKPLSTTTTIQKPIMPPKLVITSPEGHEKSECDRFTVTQTEITPCSRRQSSSSSASVSWGTAASHEPDELNGKDSSDDNLEDVIVLRL